MITLQDDEADRMLKESVLRSEIALGRTLREDEVAMLERAVLSYIAEQREAPLRPQ